MTKKLSLVALICILSFGLFAQDSVKDSSSVKNSSIEKGKFSLEGQINPNFDGGNWFRTASIRGRYFIKTNRALRLSYSPYFTTITEKFAQNSDGTGDVGTVKYSFNRQTFALAYEYHLGKKENFSPYLGYGLSFSYINEKETSTNVESGQYTRNYSSSYKQSTYGYGLFAMAGFDWYVISNMYLGFELGLGFIANYEGKLKFTETNEEDQEYPGGSQALFVIDSNGGIRIGWRF